MNFDPHTIGVANEQQVQVEDSSEDKKQYKVPAKFFWQHSIE